MGKHDLVTSALKGAALHNSSRILVVAQPHNLDVLRLEASGDMLPSLTLA